MMLRSASVLAPSLLLAGCTLAAGLRTPVGPAVSAAPAPAPATTAAPASPTAAPSAAPVACAEELGADASSKLPHAVAIEPGRVDGCMAPYDEGDAFRIAAPAGPPVIVELAADPVEDWQLCLEVLDEDRARVASSCERGVRRRWVVVAGGTSLHVLVRPFQVDYADGKTLRPYALTVTSTAVPDPTTTATSRERAATLAPGASARGYLIDPVNGAEDVDVFAIPVARAGTLEVVVDEVPDTAELTLELLDRDGKRVARSHTSTPGAVARLTDDVAAGTYYLRMTSPSYRRNPHGDDRLPEHLTRPYRVTATVR